jgi:epoxyqueuosine reductase
MNLTEEIKEQALYLGYSAAGAAPADDFSGFIAELEGRNDFDFHIKGPLDPLNGARPRSIMPEARSALALALDYLRTDFPEPLLRMIARPYLARCYQPPAASLGGARLALMLDFLKQKGCAALATQRAPARWAGACAGVSTFGRNNFAYLKGAGSFIILFVILLDKELEYDRPTMECPCPPNCRACLEACPTGAIYEPFKLNPSRCLAFVALKTQSSTDGGVSAVIPPDLRSKMGLRVHGCEVCQEVCPRNQAKLRAKYPDDAFLTRLAADMTLEALLEMPEGFFESRVRPIMYNYLKEPKYFQRNAAVAMGNSGDPRYLTCLGRALASEPEELVRAHVAWALGRLGGPKAAAALKAARAREKSDLVRAEIESARGVIANFGESG